MKFPTINRPIYEGLTTDEEKVQAMSAELAELQKVGDDGVDFAGKTAMWVAYERWIESQRDDKLFEDCLAQHFVEPYGKRLSDCFAFGLHHAVFDPPGADIGFEYEGHVMYTAARTRLINDQLATWLKDETKQQVLNLGAGADTRVYWLEALRKASMYYEIDTASLFAYKTNILEKLKQNGELPEPFCPRKSIVMDFSKESIADLVSGMHADSGFQSVIPTCWILEGLIMYLERSAVEQLMDELSLLSSKGSCLILNFSTNAPQGPTVDELDERLQGHGWQKGDRLFFGDEHFSYGRYPEGKPANRFLGFSFYSKPLTSPGSD